MENIPEARNRARPSADRHYGRDGSKITVPRIGQVALELGDQFRGGYGGDHPRRDKGLPGTGSCRNHEIHPLSRRACQTG